MLQDTIGTTLCQYAKCFQHYSDNIMQISILPPNIIRGIKFSNANLKNLENIIKKMKVNEPFIQGLSRFRKLIILGLFCWENTSPSYMISHSEANDLGSCTVSCTVFCCGICVMLQLSSPSSDRVLALLRAAGQTGIIGRCSFLQHEYTIVGKCHLLNFQHGCHTGEKNNDGYSSEQWSPNRRPL